jgi:hypothetical protein
MLPVAFATALTHAATTAGTVSLGAAALGNVGPDDVSAGVLPCIGGGGFQQRDALRFGGEGRLCANRNANLNFAGAVGGWAGERQGQPMHALLGSGIGWFDLDDSGANLRSTFFYLRPTFGVERPTGLGTVELDVYAMLPISLVQRIRGEMQPVGAFPYVGVELTLRVGEAREREVRVAHADSTGGSMGIEHSDGFSPLD